MAKSHLFVADFRDLPGLERAMDDRDYGNRVAEVTEQREKIWAISGTGSVSRLCERPRVAAIYRLGSHFQDLLWKDVVKSKIE